MGFILNWSGEMCYTDFLFGFFFFKLLRVIYLTLIKKTKKSAIIKCIASVPLLIDCD